MAATRREFLQATLGASSLLAFGPATPEFLHHTALAAAPRRKENDTILVVLQLAGGNDGLNTIVPYADDAYARARPTLRFTGSQVIKIATDFGFHPQLRAFERLFKEGLLSVLHGVGYPHPQQGHGESMHIWQSAELAYAEAQTGWIGRCVDQLWTPERAALPAAFVGEIARPAALNGRTAIVPTIRTLESAMLQAGRGDGGEAYLRASAQLAEQPRGNPEDPLLQFVRKSTLEAYATNRQIVEAAGLGTAQAEYPRTQLAGQLSLIARLIRAGLGMRIYYTELGGAEPGGFDTHAGQSLNHGALLQQLSEAVAAFVDDLQRDRLLDRVLLLTFSEFGRTVQENGRRGTDHGAAQPLFLAGGGVKGGMIGKHPSLTDLENGGQKHNVDFRAVYATLLDQWLGFASRPVLGEAFPPADVLRTR